MTGPSMFWKGGVQSILLDDTEKACSYCQREMEGRGGLGASPQKKLLRTMLTRMWENTLLKHERTLLLSLIFVI